MVGKKQVSTRFGGFLNHQPPGTPCSQPFINGWKSMGWWTKSLHRKWLEITKHPFINGCLGFQATTNWAHIFRAKWFNSWPNLIPKSTSRIARGSLLRYADFWSINNSIPPSQPELRCAFLENLGILPFIARSLLCLGILDTSSSLAAFHSQKLVELCWVSYISADNNRTNKAEISTGLTGQTELRVSYISAS